MATSDTERPQTLTRQQLYDLVWSTPMSRLAKSFGLSDVGLAKICDRVDVPTPPRGYWAKKRAGKRVSRRRLPRSAEPDEVVLEVAPSTEPKPEPPPSDPLDPDVEACLQRLESADPIEISDDSSRLHPLVARTKRVLQRGVKEERRNQFGYVEAPWRSAPCPLAIDVSEGQLDRAFRIMDALIRGLAKHGFKTTVQDEERSRSARTRVLGELFSLRVRERLTNRRFDPRKDQRDKHAWRDPKVVWEQTGVLELELTAGGGSWIRRVWKDGKKQRIEDKLLKVIRHAVSTVQSLRKSRELARQREIQRREEEAARQREAEKRRREQRRVDALLGQVARWERACQIRGFLERCRRDSDESPALEEWLRWVEAVADQVDPLANGVEAVFETVEGAGGSLW